MNLKTLRLNEGLTQSQMIEEIKKVCPKMDAPLYCKIERGICLPTREVAEVISDVLGQSVEAIFGEDASFISFDEEEKEPEDIAIIHLIPIGKKNAIKRDDLSFKLGMSDRMMRKEIQKAREVGFIIINAQDGEGYYQSDDLDELEAQYRQMTARAMSILKQRKRIRKILKSAGRKV